MDNPIDKLIKENLFYFFIGCMISSDHLISLDACKQTLNDLKVLEDALETSTLKDEKVEYYIREARIIIEKDLECFKK